MEPANPQPGGLFTSVGGALFGRTAQLLSDEASAGRAAEDLFVRFVVYGRGQTLDSRARWNWIYRVATGHCLRQLPAEARPGEAGDAAAGASSPVSLPASTRAPVPDMRALRAFDEATQSIVVLALVDGLTPDEISEVLGLSGDVVRRRLADAEADGPADHPSSLALVRDRLSHSLHLDECTRCREVIDSADRRADHFAREIAPLVGQRVTAAIRAERAHAAGPRWKKMFWMAGAFVLVAGLALLVSRPRKPDRTQVPYAGLKGASRAKVSGIQITVRRGEEVRALAPETRLRVGDRLHFRVRAEHPRYLELRLRGPDGQSDVRVFPGAGTVAALVRPGEALDRDYVVGAIAAGGEKGGHKLWIIGLFAEAPFPLDRPPGPDTEVVPVRVDTEP